MPKWCSVGTCNNHHLLRDESGKTAFSFFKFPPSDKDPERRQKWATFCGRVDPVTGEPWAPKSDVKHVYICSAHFVTGQ